MEPLVDLWAVVVLYEFDEGGPESVVAFEGTLIRCERLAARLDEIGHVSYVGELAGRKVLQAIPVVCRADAVGDAAPGRWQTA